MSDKKPQSVRNFWIEATIDGRKSRLEGGPVGKDGGMDVVIKMRDKGEIIVAYRIRCEAVAPDSEKPIVDIIVQNWKNELVHGIRRYR